MDDLKRMAIAQEIDRQIYEQREELQEAILRGCDDKDTLEETCTKMVMNGVCFSARLAAEMAIGILLESGLFTPRSDDELRKSIFSVCSGKDEGTSDI